MWATEQQEIQLMAKANVSYDAEGRSLGAWYVCCRPWRGWHRFGSGHPRTHDRTNGISQLNVKINNDGLSLGSNGEMLADVRLGGADALGILTALAPQASIGSAILALCVTVLTLT